MATTPTTSIPAQIQTCAMGSACLSGAQPLPKSAFFQINSTHSMQICKLCYRARQDHPAVASVTPVAASVKKPPIKLVESILEKRTMHSRPIAHIQARKAEIASTAAPEAPGIPKQMTKRRAQ